MIHAIQGRTGLTIACFLMFQHGISATEAINLIRAKRYFFSNLISSPKSIQNQLQVFFVHEFLKYLYQLKQIYPLQKLNDGSIHLQYFSVPFFKLISQQKLVSNVNDPQEFSHCPKVLYFPS
jgi:hypothetical protein